MRKVMLGLTAAFAAGAALFSAPQSAGAQVISVGIGSGDYYGGYGWGTPFYTPIGFGARYGYGFAQPWGRYAGYPYGYGYDAPVFGGPVYYYPTPDVRRVIYNRPVYYAPRRVVRSRVIYTRPAYGAHRVVRTRAVYSRPVYRNDRIVRRVYY